MTSFREKLVLNAGCGQAARSGLHPAFRGRDWKQVRLDADASVKPDITGDIFDLRDKIADNAFDAVWSSHSLEHVYIFEASAALREFRRVLRGDGFALITCPDLTAIAEFIVAGRLNETIYHSPAGPINPVDMLWGHQKSISAGNVFMAHKSGYTADRLGDMLIEAGFDEAWVMPGKAYDVWAIGLREEANTQDVRRLLQLGGLSFPESVGP